MSASHVKVMAILTAKEGKAGELRSLIETLIAPSRAEPGNLRYDFWVDQAEPSRFVLDELYTDSAANSAHRASPHFQNYVSKVGDLADRTAVVVTPLDVA